MRIIRKGELSPYTDNLPGVPYGYVNGRGEYVRFSKEERIAISKGKKKVPKVIATVSKETEEAIGPTTTVKRGGRWIQIRQDNLSAFIETKT